MANIYMYNKDKVFILTEFYYPAISKEASKKKVIRSLKTDSLRLSNRLGKIHKVQKSNIIDHLRRQNHTYFLLKKDEINQLYGLNDREIIKLLLNNFEGFPSFCALARESTEKSENDFFFHTRDMYMNDHKEKSLKILKTKKNILLNKLCLASAIIKPEEEEAYLIKEKKNFHNMIKTSCLINRKAKSIQLNCRDYPLKILNQNIEINFFY